MLCAVMSFGVAMGTGELTELITARAMLGNTLQAKPFEHWERSGNTHPDGCFVLF